MHEPRNGPMAPSRDQPTSRLRSQAKLIFGGALATGLQVGLVQCIMVQRWAPLVSSVENSAYWWTPSIAACGLTLEREGKLGIAFPKWKGDFFAGGLAGACVDRLRVTKDSKAPQGFVLAEREEIMHGMGRVRDVMCGPEGALYVVLNGPDKVVKIVPAGER